MGAVFGMGDVGVGGWTESAVRDCTAGWMVCACSIAPEWILLR